eukprot:2757182-Pleurochrysis_carterae.AAC.1
MFQNVLSTSVASGRGTSGKPIGCSRERKTGGPPSGEAAALKWRDTENVEHGGEATTAAYSPAAQRCSSRS